MKPKKNLPGTNQTLKRIVEIAFVAGKCIMKHYRNPHVIKYKNDNSPLTRADVAANQIIVEGLRKIKASIPIISEEVPVPAFHHRKKWKRFWLVDPLDGTKEFLKHNGEFTVNIALIEDRQPVLAVVYAPALNLLYYAHAKRGAYKHARGRITRICFKRPAKRDALTVLQSRSHKQRKALPAAIRPRVKTILHVGSSLKFCYLAEGKAHLYVRSSPSMEWDLAAGDCVYRFASQGRANHSPLAYNKSNLRNRGFMIGSCG